MIHATKIRKNENETQKKIETKSLIAAIFFGSHLSSIFEIFDRLISKS